ncbi:uncharacterized protein HKW66_Vig0171170 [Vigna angularis]|uniref:Uncharacterized protein n=1 Tax=Phaseolus angularis TaxID=3914 RepID=A0A8T0JQ26_PHAAN|nr:uncharacterized protein HKW66_Vig0171170 [Vigna angularis]
MHTLDDVPPKAPIAKASVPEAPKHLVIPSLSQSPSDATPNTPAIYKVGKVLLPMDFFVVAKAPIKGPSLALEPSQKWVSLVL